MFRLNNHHKLCRQESHILVAKLYILCQILMQDKRQVRVLTMSDTHDLHFRIDIQALPKADIFIHAGDFTKVSTAAELARFR